MTTQPYPGNRPNWCQGCNRLVAYCGCPPEPAVTPEQWAALATDYAPGLCRRCRFEYSRDDSYITFGNGSGICIRCHDRIIGDPTNLDPLVRRQVEAAVGG